MIFNLTPHAINLLTDPPLTISPSGEVARCEVHREVVGCLEGIPVNRTRFGQVEGLPAPRPGVAYIVSALVAQACPERTDVFVPDETVRDDQGRIIGCKALATLAAGAILPGTEVRPAVLQADTASAKDIALAEAVMARAGQLIRDELSRGYTGVPLADAAAEHERLVPDQLPEGIDVESQVFTHDTGHDGRVPTYLVLGDGGIYTLAAGTFYGRHSDFDVVTGVRGAAKLADRILDTATISRVLAALKRKEKGE